MIISSKYSYEQQHFLKICCECGWSLSNRQIERILCSDFMYVIKSKFKNISEQDAVKFIKKNYIEGYRYLEEAYND